MPAVQKPGNGRGWFESGMTPFVGAAPSIHPASMTGAGVFASLVNIDPSRDALRSRPAIGLREVADTYALSDAHTVFTASDGDYLVNFATASLARYCRIGDSAWKTLELPRTVYRFNTSFANLDGRLVVFDAWCNLVIESDGDGSLTARRLGISSDARIFDESYHEDLSPDEYSLARFGIECVRTKDGVPVGSSSILRSGRSCMCTNAYYFSFSFTASSSWDTLRFWRSKNLNVTDASESNVAVGTVDELYLLASIAVSALPAVGSTVTVGEDMEVECLSAGVYRFTETGPVDTLLDDTTVQGIESINLKPFPRSYGGTVSGARMWGSCPDLPGYVVYSNLQGTIYQELYDPLNLLRTGTENITAFGTLSGDVVAMSPTTTWRIPGSDPSNNIHQVGFWGCASSHMVSAVGGFGLFALNQDRRLRLFTSSMEWVDTIAGIPFSDHLRISDIINHTETIHAAAHDGNLYVVANNEIWRLAVAESCGWSKYVVNPGTVSTKISGVLAYSGELQFVTDKCALLKLDNAPETNMDGEFTGTIGDFVASVGIPVSNPSGMVELWDVTLFARLNQYCSPPSMAVKVHDAVWGSPSSMPSGILQKAGYPELARIIPSRAGTLKARPCGRYIVAEISVTIDALNNDAVLEILNVAASGVAQESVRPGWNPLAVLRS